MVADNDLQIEEALGSEPLPVENAQASLSLADIGNKPQTGSTSRAGFVRRNIKAIVVGVIVVVFAIILGSTLGTRDSTQEQPRNSSPSASYDYIIAQNWSNAAAVLSPGSPQRKAADALSSPMDASQYAFLVLYYATGEWWQDFVDWDKPFCQWNEESFGFLQESSETGGVTCNSEGVITKLDLEFNNMKGTLPTEIGLFTTLQELDVEFNPSLGGTIPTEMCKLSQLSSLRLRQTSLDGTLPACDWTNLQELYAGNNSLTGSLTTEHCAMMRDLESLVLSFNEFTGSLPSCDQYSSLQTIQLDNNRFTGTLPSGWIRSRIVDLQNNMFSGELPADIAAWADLVSLQLHNNEIVGTLPSSPTWSQLETLSVYNNRLTGQLPKNLEQWKKIRNMRLSNNDFTGYIPKSLALCGETMQELFLDDNQLGGNPISIVNNLTSLRYLYLENNHFRGPIDENFCRQTPSIEAVDLSSNNFTSSHLPDHIVELPNLKILDMSNNSFRGTLPAYLPGESKLHFFSLHGNDFTGTVPGKVLRNMTQAIHINLSSNGFSGTIPTELFMFTRLQHLFLSDNPFSAGPIPEEIGGMEQLSEISLKRTNLIGTLPEFTSFDVLSLIDFDQNDLSGTIPSSYGGLPSLRFLLLSRNPRLMGPVPIFSRPQNLQTVVLDGTSVSGDFSSICQLPRFRDGVSGDNNVVVVNCSGASDTSIQCSCCSCCEIEAGCSDAMLASLDWTWEHGYQRQARDFGLNTSET